MGQTGDPGAHGRTQEPKYQGLLPKGLDSPDARYISSACKVIYVEGNARAAGISWVHLEVQTGEMDVIGCIWLINAYNICQTMYVVVGLCCLCCCFSYLSMIIYVC